MPSAETVEIDAANNDVAILDASDCALVATSSSSSSLVSASLLSSSSIFDGFATLKESSSNSSSNNSNSNTVTQCSQESEMVAVAESGNAAKEGNDDDNAMVEEKESPGSGRQVSPKPQKRGATIVTPRSMRKAPPTMTTTAPSMPSSSTSSSSSSGGQGKNKGKPSPSTSYSRKSKKGATEAVAVAVDSNVDGVDSTTPTTPSSTSSISHPSTAFPSGAAIATPGGEDSAIKMKKKNEAALLPKNPTTTLHSFFRKVDPSAKKKTVEVTNKADVKKVEVSNAGEEKVTTVGVVAGKISSSRVNGDEVEKINEEPTSNHGKVVVAVVEKSVASPKETAAGIHGGSKNDKAPGKKKRGMPQPQDGKVTSKMKRNDVSAVIEGASSVSFSSSSSLSTSCRKLAEKRHDDNEEDLDDSPAFALAAALRTINNGRRGKSRHISSGGGHPEVVVRNENENKTTNNMVAPTPTDERATDALQHDKSSSFPDTVVEVFDPVRIDSNYIDIDRLQNMRDTPFAGTSSTVAIDENAIAPTSEMEEKFELEENPADNADTNDVNKKEAALSKTVEVSYNVSTDIVQEQQTTCDPINKEGKETTRNSDTEISVDAEIGDEKESDGSIKETTVDEAKVVDEVKEVPATSAESKPTRTKVSPKPRKQKNSMPSNKLSNTKTASVSSVAKGQSSIPAKTQISLSTTTELHSGAKSNSASSSDSIALSPEDASRLHHYLTLRAKYAGRASELGNLPSSDTFEEENLCLEGTLDKGSVELGEDGRFPDKLLTHLQVMTQGSSQPLSELTKRALDELSPFITDSKPLTIDSISSKIKLLAQRKSYLSRLPTATFEKCCPISKLDCFENTENCYMWRWELCSLDLLPQPESGKVKKARAMRKKLQSHYKAIINLITATDKAILGLQGCANTNTSSVGATLAAKISDLEEKVLKFEREEERTRLLKEAELHKQKTKAEELAEKQLAKERIEEERRNEKKRLEEEKRNEKKRKDEEREQKRAEANRIKNEEKEKKKQEIEEKENKRKARIMMFFSNGSSTKKAKVSSSGATQKNSDEISSFDNDAFRKLINSQDNHVDTYSFAKGTRRRKTAKVRVSVFVTVLSENAFAPQPYDEERVIVVPNRYKFLGFHEDVRPPYRGTWSKRSSFVTGRRPLGKDTKYLDYDVDSEEEWEEGDDEDGEDLVDGDDGADEEEDMLNEDDNDGWLAAEDDLGLEEDDDETRELRKKNLCNESNSLSGKRNNSKACVVAPCVGGLPHDEFDGDIAHCFIEGFTPEDVMDVLNSHVGYVITPDVSICLDAFPPSESINDTNQPNFLLGKSPASQNKEMTLEAQKIMAVFVHNSTLTSKDIVVTELLKLHPSLTNSRAQAVRELDVIAAKRRLANGAGVLWEVKADHLNKLELSEKDLKQPPTEASPPTSPVEEGKTKKVRDPNAPKRNASAFLMFSNATRNVVRDANPNAAVADINKILSENFKSLSSEERYSKEIAQYFTGPDFIDSKLVAAEAVVVQTAEPRATVAESPPKSVETQASCSNQSSAKKRKTPAVSRASADLLAKFMKKKQKKVGGEA